MCLFVCDGVYIEPPNTLPPSPVVLCGVLVLCHWLIRSGPSLQLSGAVINMAGESPVFIRDFLIALQSQVQTSAGHIVYERGV